ncbi:hypothetical protein NHQ30_006186 [Ciborinia camelliae]|nr:hypothetical protein NHQ30_006186 [Ciborinia camelliae]
MKIPPTTNGFHKSFLNKFFGPINRTLNSIPPSHMPNPVEWDKFFTIHLDTQPYIFPQPIEMQTYGQIVNFISQNTTEACRATRGTTYPVLLRLSHGLDQYHYIGHFVVNNVVTTTEFDELMENMPENEENTKHTKHKLLKERDRALGSAAASSKDMPVDFYTIQYVFFGEEQYRILVDAQEKFDALESANHTIDSLLESHDRNPTSVPLPPNHKNIPKGPASMHRRHASISEGEKSVMASNRNTMTTAFPLLNTIPNAPAAIRRMASSRGENENLSELESKHHNTMNTAILPPNKIPSGPALSKEKNPSDGEKENLSGSNISKNNTVSTHLPLPNHAPPPESPNESTSMKRKYPFGDENESPWEGGPQWKKKNGPGSVQIGRIRQL